MSDDGAPPRAGQYSRRRRNGNAPRAQPRRAVDLPRPRSEAARGAENEIENPERSGEKERDDIAADSPPRRQPGRRRDRRDRRNEPYHEASDKPPKYSAIHATTPPTNVAVAGKRVLENPEREEKSLVTFQSLLAQLPPLPRPSAASARVFVHLDSYLLTANLSRVLSDPSQTPEPNPFRPRPLFRSCTVMGSEATGKTTFAHDLCELVTNPSTFRPRQFHTRPTRREGRGLTGEAPFPSFHFNAYGRGTESSAAVRVPFGSITMSDQCLVVYDLPPVTTEPERDMRADERADWKRQCIAHSAMLAATIAATSHVVCWFLHKWEVLELLNSKCSDSVMALRSFVEQVALPSRGGATTNTQAPLHLVVVLVQVGSADSDAGGSAAAGQALERLLRDAMDGSSDSVSLSLCYTGHSSPLRASLAREVFSSHLVHCGVALFQTALPRIQQAHERHCRKCGMPRRPERPQRKPQREHTTSEYTTKPEPRVDDQLSDAHSSEGNDDGCFRVTGGP